MLRAKIHVQGSQLSSGKRYMQPGTALLAARCSDISCDWTRDRSSDGNGLFFKMTLLTLYSVQSTVRASSPVTKYVPLVLFLVCLASLTRLLLVLNEYILRLLATPTRVRLRGPYALASTVTSSIIADPRCWSENASSSGDLLV